MGTVARTISRLLLFATISAIVFAQSTGQGAISGTVIEASSGEPVRRAIVTVTWQGTPRSWATYRTDSSGRFAFTGLPPGKYDLRATKTGLGTATYGANRARESGEPITLGPSETRLDLKLRFLRFGSISGHIVDRDGDPVPNVEVNLLRPGRNLGERILVNYRGTSTDDRGDYKIPGIDPGDYYLLCKPNGGGQTVALTHEILVQQYFGGARESKDAKVLTIRGNESLTGLDFRLTSEHTTKITGRVTGVPALDPPDPPENLSVPVLNDGFSNRRISIRRFNPGPFVTVELGSVDATQPFSNMGTGTSGPDYRFELPDVAPGRYRIQATLRSKDKSYYATQVINPMEGTMDLVLTLVPAAIVKGHLSIEGPAPGPLESFTVTLNSPAGPNRQSHSSPVTKDGSFAINDVPPGEWLLNIGPSQGGLFDKSVRLGDKDFLYQRLEIPPASQAPLNIVISTNTATIEGEIDGGGADAKRAGILLGPVGKLHGFTRFYYAAVADDSGEFKLTGVAPGKYKIFALEKLATTNFRTPEAADQLEALGEELDIAEGAKVEAHPKLIPEEKAREILKP